MAASTKLLIEVHRQLAASNRAVAQAGLLRTPDRASSLLEAIEKQAIGAEQISADVQQRLINHANEPLRAKARQLFSKSDSQ